MLRMHGVVFTEVFERQAKEAGLKDDELMAIAATLAENPLSGDLMPGTGGARKVRFAREVKVKVAAFAPFTISVASMCPYFFSLSSTRASEATCRCPKGTCWRAC
jgi:hypothetical protein